MISGLKSAEAAQDFHWLTKAWLHIDGKRFNEQTGWLVGALIKYDGRDVIPAWKLSNIQCVSFRQCCPGVKPNILWSQFFVYQPAGPLSFDIPIGCAANTRWCCLTSAFVTSKFLSFLCHPNHARWITSPGVYGCSLGWMTIFYRGFKRRSFARIQCPACAR